MVKNLIKLSSPDTNEFWEVDVLYEDADLLALNKPAGLAVSPEGQDASAGRPNLLGLLHSGIAQGKPWARDRQLHFLLNCNRGDVETSGVVLFARSKPVHARLAELFGSEKPLTHYVALVQGGPDEEKFEVNAKLAPHPVHSHRMRVDSRNGKRSRTMFEVRERFEGWTLLRCEPLTLRKHQVRVHLSSVGLPIVADPLYGGKPLLLSRLKQGYRLKPQHVERPLIGSLALHANELVLQHPVTAAPLNITAPWPKDLQVGVKYLRRYGIGTRTAAPTEQPDK